MPFLRHLISDESGQDLVEYVLLGATVALAGLVAMNAFGPIINAVYLSWQSSTQNLWYPDPPAP
jgi:Flp pilus assembly pilin Flp